jgi:uncharacterized protein (DUF2345 family)
MPVPEKPLQLQRRQIGEHEQVILETQEGQRITLDGASQAVVIQDATGNQIRLEGGKITVTSAGTLVLQAAMVQIDAGQVTMNAGMVQCSGVVQADTVIANSVIAASYTPGAGNVW